MKTVNDGPVRTAHLYPRLLANVYPADVTDEEFRRFQREYIVSSECREAALCAAVLLNRPCAESVDSYTRAVLAVLSYCEHWYAVTVAARESWSAEELRDAMKEGAK